MVFLLVSLVSVNPQPDPRLEALMRAIPADDARILSDVADSYDLQGESRRLLFAIRIIENGGPGREMGVLHPRAMRFKGNHSMSLKLQAQWAAGTIHKRFTGDLAAFAARWCPVEAHPMNKNWLPAVRKLMKIR